MRNVKRAALSILSALVIASSLTGCKGKSEVSAPGLVTDEKLEGSLISKEPLELSIHLHYGDTRVFNDDWPIFKKVAELTNIKLKGTAPKSATTSKEVFNLMMVSGKLPDIIHGEKIDMNKAGTDGALEPLDELIDKYAPNIKKFLADNPWAKKGTVAGDGKLYYIPYVLDGTASEGWYIRQDWLNKLGLTVPKTVDEYYNVLKAFKEKDPNGNGKADEVPFISRNVAGITYLAPLFGARTGWYVKSGNAAFGKMEPEYKTAMINIKKWYAEGLIDKEIFTRGAKARDILLGDNVGGSTHDWFASTAQFNDSLKSKIPDFQFLPIAPPADINGKVWEEKGRLLLSTHGWGISKENKYQIQTIKYFDFWFTPEGRRLHNFGIEGTHYTMVNGKPVFKDEILHGKEPTNQLLWNDGAQIEVGVQMDYAYEQQWTNPVAAKGVQMYIDNKYIVDQFPSLSFTEEEQKVLSTKWNSIDTYIKEMEQKWIMGGEPLTDTSFEKYVAQLKSMGMDEVTKIYNTAYQRYIKN